MTRKTFGVMGKVAIITRGSKDPGAGLVAGVQGVDLAVVASARTIKLSDPDALPSPETSSSPRPVLSRVSHTALLIANGDADLCIRMRRRDEPRQGGEPGLVGWLVPHPPGVPAQHRVLVPEYQQFGVLRLVPAEHQDSQAKCPAHEQAGDLEQHPAANHHRIIRSCETAGQRCDRVSGRHRMADAARSEDAEAALPGYGRRRYPINKIGKPF
jgi:hypothetical protein